METHQDRMTRQDKQLKQGDILIYKLRMARATMAQALAKAEVKHE